MTTYSHNTELRHLQPKDLYELSLILDDNDGWIRLLENIPKGLNNQNLSRESIIKSLNEYGSKYSNHHVQIILDACKDPGQMKSQLFLEEWSISGNKHERPTLKVLLLLLIQVELFRAADFVSINLLKELPPTRPNKGLAAPVNTSLPSEIFCDIEEMLNDDCAAYPNTEDLQQKLTNALDINKDYFIKHHEIIKKIPTNENCPPKPPPRRGGKLQKQYNQQRQQGQWHLTDSQTAENKVGLSSHKNDLFMGANASTEITNLSQSSKCITDNSLPNLSILIKDDKTAKTNNHCLSGQAEQTIKSDVDLQDNNECNDILNARNESNCVPRLSILLNSCTTITNGYNKDDNIDAIEMIHSKNVPVQNYNGDLLPKLSTVIEANNVVKLSNVNADINNELTSKINSSLPKSKAIACESIQDQVKWDGNSKIIDNIEIIELPTNNEEQMSLKSAKNANQMVNNSTVETPNGNEIVNNTECYAADNDNSEDDDDDDDNSMPNLSIFDQGSSLYDSSLTSVTGTSGDNSLDLSLGSSITSLDNVPNLSELKN